MAEFKEDEVTSEDQELVSFVVDHCNGWRDHRNVNYLDNPSIMRMLYWLYFS